MEIKVLGLKELQPFKGWPDYAISLMDTDTPDNGFPDFPLAKAHLKLKFADIIPHNPEGFARGFNPQLAKDIINFIQPIKTDEKLLIHCHAGIARSSGVALCILGRTRTPEEAMNELYRIRPQCWPNEFVVSTLEYEMNGMDDLVLAVREFKEKWNGKLDWSMVFEQEKK